MKKLFLAATLLALVGCASDDIIKRSDLAYMSRQEVAIAIKDCESYGLRPNVIYTRAMWQLKSVPVPIDVQCTPKDQR